MSLNELFNSIEKARETAHWRAAFGEPQVLEDKTIIPVARVTYGFGLGFGSGSQAAQEEGEPAPGGEGGGGGGGSSAKPLGAFVVTPDCVYFEQVRDDRTIAVLGMAFVAFCVFQVARTLRALFGRA